MIKCLPIVKLRATVSGGPRYSTCQKYSKHSGAAEFRQVCPRNLLTNPNGHFILFNTKMTQYSKITPSPFQREYLFLQQNTLWNCRYIVCKYILYFIHTHTQIASISKAYTIIASYLLFTEARRRHQITWSWSYRRL